MLTSKRNTICNQDIHQSRQCTRSHTLNAMTSGTASDLESSPLKLNETGSSVPEIPRKSSQRNLQSAQCNNSASSSTGSDNRLIRPIPISQSVSSHFTGRANRQVPQSSNGTAGNTGSIRFKGGSPIRKGLRSPCKISHSVTTVLAGSHGYACNAAGSGNSIGSLKPSRSKTRNVFAKFAEVLTEHFSSKSFRKGDRTTEPTESAVTSCEATTQQIIGGRPLTRASCTPLPTPFPNVPNTEVTSLASDDVKEHETANLSKIRAKAGQATERKRLTIVDEVDFHNGASLEDPFSESSSGQHTTDFEARLQSKKDHRGGPVSTDPFQAENILESSLDAILTTPPVGCSTPRLRILSPPQCETPTHSPREPDHVADLISFSPREPSTDLEQRRKVPNVRGGSRKETQPLKDSRKRGLTGKLKSGPESSTSSDATRLSSFPPGSTIRHVPRSMGRLTDAPTSPNSNVERTKTLPLRRKKHPSPSKGQLELFGKYMENNLAMGVFKDADELRMSFSLPHPGTSTLSPRDTNQLMRNTAKNSVDLRADYTNHVKHTALPKTRSRIPQPVRQLSRCRTKTAFARDFIPANKGDSTMGDELQWDASEYKIGPRCNHCGSTNKIV